MQTKKQNKIYIMHLKQLLSNQVKNIRILGKQHIIHPLQLPNIQGDILDKKKKNLSTPNRIKSFRQLTIQEMKMEGKRIRQQMARNLNLQNYFNTEHVQNNEKKKKKIEKINQLQQPNNMELRLHSKKQPRITVNYNLTNKNQKRKLSRNIKYLHNNCNQYKVNHIKNKSKKNHFQFQTAFDQKKIILQQLRTKQPMKYSPIMNILLKKEKNISNKATGFNSKSNGQQYTSQKQNLNEDKESITMSQWHVSYNQLQ